MEIRKRESITYSYGLFSFSMDPAWIAGIEYTYNKEQSYRSWTEFKGKIVQIVSINQISHKIRNPGTPIFHDGENAEGERLTATERVVRILSGFESGTKIKPIILYRDDNIDECMEVYRLHDGCHRLHCSLFYGYKYIPAIVYRKQDLMVGEINDT